MKALEIKNLSKNYNSDEYAIKNISFNVSKKAFHILIGKNGSGKTTIIKSVVGAYAKFEGEVKIFNQSNLGKNSHDKLAYIPEKTIFPQNLTVFQYLFFMYHVCQNVSLKKARVETSKCLEKLNLEWLKNENPNFLSSGQKKKILLVQALMKKAEVIIMDEPTAALDPFVRQKFLALIKKINDEGTTIVIATHVVSEIQPYANEITIIERGNVKFTGKLEKQSILSLYKKHTQVEEGFGD